MKRAAFILILLVIVTLTIYAAFAGYGFVTTESGIHFVNVAEHFQSTTAGL